MTADVQRIAAGAFRTSCACGRCGPCGAIGWRRANVPRFGRVTGGACASIRRTITNARRPSFPPQPVKLTTCQSRRRAAGTAGGLAKHRAREKSRQKRYSVDTAYRMAQWNEAGGKRRDGRCDPLVRRRTDARRALRLARSLPAWAGHRPGGPGHRRKMILTCNAVLTAGCRRSSEAPTRVMPGAGMRPASCTPPPHVPRQTAFGAALPSSTAATLSSAVKPIWSRVSIVALAMCGDRNTLSSAAKRGSISGSFR